MQRNLVSSPNESAIPRGAPPKWIQSLLQCAAIAAIAVLAGLVVNAVRPDGIPLVADWSMKAQVSSAIQSAEDPVISLEEAAALYQTGGAIFIDARPEEFFREGHIAGARSLAWDDFENRFAEVMNDVPPDSLIVTYCDGDACSLSKDLAAALLGKGYPHVRVLLNGWSVWQQAGLPAE